MKRHLSLLSAVFLTCLAPCLTFTLSGCAMTKTPGQDTSRVTGQGQRPGTAHQAQ